MEGPINDFEAAKSLTGQVLVACQCKAVVIKLIVSSVKRRKTWRVMPIMRRADVDSDRNHRNPEGLSTIDTFREYGIAAVAVASIHVSKGDT